MTDGGDDLPELGRRSLWLLRVGAVVFVAVLLWFLVDAIPG